MVYYVCVYIWSISIWVVEEAMHVTSCIIHLLNYGVCNQPKRWSIFLWNGSRFTLNRMMANGTMYWRCSRCSCPTWITTQGDELLQQTNGHNHAVDPTESRMEQIKSNLTYLLTFPFLLHSSVPCYFLTWKYSWFSWRGLPYSTSTGISNSGLVVDRI